MHPIRNRLLSRSLKTPLRLLPWALFAPACAAVLPSGWSATQTPAQIPPGVAATALAPNLAAASATATPISDNDTRLITVTISLRLRNPEGLTQAAIEAGRSGHFLSPEEIRDRFAPTQAQADALADYLRQCGFQHVEIAANRMLVTAQGRPAAIRKAFHTGLSRFSYQGREVYANAGPVLVPHALGPIVGRVLGLENVHPIHTGPMPPPPMPPMHTGPMPTPPMPPIHTGPMPPPPMPPIHT